MSRSPNDGQRLLEIDSLRGLAALSVVGYHYTTRVGEVFGANSAPPVSLAFGNYGVQLFFLISGFVIFMTLERCRSAGDFVKSRISRLFPAYWASILVSALFVYSIGTDVQRVPLRDVIVDFTMIQEFLGARHLDGVYWTLQVELFFYVQMLFWYMIGKLRYISWIIVGWLLLGVGVTLLEKSGADTSSRLFQLAIVAHLPFFGIGILMYRIHSGAGSLVWNALLIALCVLQVAFTHSDVYIAVAVVCSAVFALSIGGRLRWLTARPFVFVGGISYSLYLLHQAIGFSVIHWLEEHGMRPTIAALVAAVGSILLATAMTYGVEKPALRWLRARWARKAPPLAAIAAPD